MASTEMYLEKSRLKVAKLCVRKDMYLFLWRVRPNKKILVCVTLTQMFGGGWPFLFFELFLVFFLM